MVFSSAIPKCGKQAEAANQSQAADQALSPQHFGRRDGPMVGGFEL